MLRTGRRRAPIFGSALVTVDVGEKPLRAHFPHHRERLKRLKQFDLKRLKEWVI
jgi:hypothetical protein